MTKFSELNQHQYVSRLVGLASRAEDILASVPGEGTRAGESAQAILDLVEEVNRLRVMNPALDYKPKDSYPNLSTLSGEEEFQQRLETMCINAKYMAFKVIYKAEDAGMCAAQARMDVSELVSEVRRLRKKLKEERRQVRKSKRRLKNRASALEARLAQEGNNEA